MQSFLRQRRGGGVSALRCLVLVATQGGAGGVTTLDVDPERFAQLPRIDRDPDVRGVLMGVFRLALQSGGIGGMTKN